MAPSASRTTVMSIVVVGVEFVDALVSGRAGSGAASS